MYISEYESKAGKFLTWMSQIKKSMRLIANTLQITVLMLNK